MEGAVVLSLALVKQTLLPQPRQALLDLAAGVYPDTLTEALYDGYLHGFWHVH